MLLPHLVSPSAERAASASAALAGLTSRRMSLGLVNCLAAACTAIFFPAFGQMGGLPKINLNDTTITTRDSLRFAPQTFGMCLYGYQSQYEITTDASMDSISRHLIRLTSRQNPNCATAAGYSGPVIVLKDLPAGIHRLAFTDSSDFKLAIPDSVRITVIEASSLRLRAPRMGRTPSPSGAASPLHAADGRQLREEPGAMGVMGVTPVFRR